MGKRGRYKGTIDEVRQRKIKIRELDAKGKSAAEIAKTLNVSYTMVSMEIALVKAEYRLNNPVPIQVLRERRVARCEQAEDLAIAAYLNASPQGKAGCVKAFIDAVETGGKFDGTFENRHLVNVTDGLADILLQATKTAMSKEEKPSHPGLVAAAKIAEK